MLATPETISAPTPWARLAKKLPQWRQIPLYHSRLADDTSSPEKFSRLPFVTKQELRENFPTNFLPPEKDLDALLAQGVAELEYTSGTSDERTPVLFRHGWWDEQERHALSLNPFIAGTLTKNPAARRATLTPPVCNGRACPTVWASHAQRIIGHTLYLNLARIPFTLTETEQARMTEEILDWSPAFLDMDPVHAVWFARYCEPRGIRFPSVRFILSSYEFLSVVHRRILERVFGVPVFNLYGSTEAGHLLMQDESGRMLPSGETAFLEIVAADATGVGELVATSLSNELMPLLRYRTGDLAEQRGETYVLHGRARDALRSTDGRRVTTLEVDRCFQSTGEILHYELRQQPDGGCALRFIPDGDGPGAAELSSLVKRLESLLNPAGKIVVESVPMVIPSHSGKFRLTHPGNI